MWLGLGLQRCLKGEELEGAECEEVQQIAAKVRVHRMGLGLGLGWGWGWGWAYRAV